LTFSPGPGGVIPGHFLLPPAIPGRVAQALPVAAALYEKGGQNDA